MRRSMLLFFTVLSLVGITAGDIKDVTISGDSRQMIHFEWFGFTAAGVANVAVSEATFSSSSSASSPDPALLGFFLVSTSNFPRAIAFGTRLDPNYNPQNPNPSCILSSPYIRLLFTFRDLPQPPFNSYNRSSPVTIPGEYGLYFANCAPDTEVSMTVRTVLYNSLPDGRKDYLPVGDSQIPSVCFDFGVLFLVFLVIWIGEIIWNWSSSRRIHYLMCGLLLAKSATLLFRAEYWYYLSTTGTHHGDDLLFYLFPLSKLILLFTAIVLIEMGWPFLRPLLQTEKEVLMSVIALQALLIYFKK